MMVNPLVYPVTRRGSSGPEAPASGGSSLTLLDVTGINWAAVGAIAGNSYAVVDLGVMTPAALANSPAMAIFAGQDINVGLVINTAEVDSSGHLIIQILNTIPASVGPAIEPAGDVTVLYAPA